MIAFFRQHRQIAGRALSFILGIGLLFLLLKQINLPDVWHAATQITPLFLWLGAISYGFKAIMRTFRIVRLNSKNTPGFLRMLRLSLASSLASQVLPFKLGELSYIYLLKRENRASLSQGVSSLLVLRLLDVLAIALLFLIFFFTASLPSGFSPYFTPILLFFCALLLVLLALFILAFYDNVLLDVIFHRFKIERFPFANRVRSLLAGFLQSLKEYTPVFYLEAVFLALLEWLVNYSTFYFLLSGMGMNVGFVAVVACVTFSALASLLPINSFGNFGTQEAGWAAAMMLFGNSSQVALVSGFSTHLVTVAYMLVAGGISWLSYFIWQKEPFQGPVQP